MSVTIMSILSGEHKDFSSDPVGFEEGQRIALSLFCHVAQDWQNGFSASSPRYDTIRISFA